MDALSPRRMASVQSVTRMGGLNSISHDSLSRRSSIPGLQTVDKRLESFARQRQEKEKQENMKKKKKYKLSEKGLLKKLQYMTQKKYEYHLQLLEDRAHRRQMRQIRRDHGDPDLSDDSDDEEIDKYNGLSEEEKWNRMMNEAREELREEEVRRLLTREKKRQNTLQNKLRRQGQEGMTVQSDKIQTEVEQKVEQLDVFKKELVIMEPLSCVNTALEMCLIGYQETLRFLGRNDIQSQFEKASLQQCQISVELAFHQRKSPIQVKAEMLWRFAVIMHDYSHGARGQMRYKYLVLSSHAYMLLYDQVMLERERRDAVRNGDDDDAKARLAPEAEWEEGKPDLYWELGALVNSMEMEMDEEDAVNLYNEMESVNNASAFARLRQQVARVPIPEDVAPPDS